MFWYKGIFGKDEDTQQVVAAKKAPPPPSPAFPEDNVAAPKTGGKKVTLNFKKLPKKMVQAIADQTTGQEIDRKEEESGTQKKRSRLMGEFNDAARGITGRDDDNDRMMARAALAQPPRAMPSPAMPRGPSP